MSIFEKLKNDHTVIQQILSGLILLSETELLQRDLLIKQLEEELFSHTRAEEIVLYNPLRQADFSKRLALHGYKEHLEVETLLHLLQLKNAVHIDWKETALRLQESLQLHFQDEEVEIFNMAQDFFAIEESEWMGQAFYRLKAEIKQVGYSEIQTESLASASILPLQTQQDSNLNRIAR